MTSTHFKIKHIVLQTYFGKLVRITYERTSVYSHNLIIDNYIDFKSNGRRFTSSYIADPPPTDIYHIRDIIFKKIYESQILI